MGLSVSLSFKCQQQQQPAHRWKYQQKQQQEQHELQPKHLHRKNHHRQQKREQQQLQQQHTPQHHQRGQKHQIPRFKQQQQYDHSCITRATQESIYDESSCSNECTFVHKSANEIAITTITKKCSSTSNTKGRTHRLRRTWPPVVSNISTHCLQNTTRKTFSWILATFLFTVTFIAPITTSAAAEATTTTLNAAGTLMPATFSLNSNTNSNSITSRSSSVSGAPFVLSRAAAPTKTIIATTTTASAAAAKSTIHVRPPESKNIANVIATISQEAKEEGEVENNDVGIDKRNEQQLLHFYRQAQHEQPHHRHRQRDAPPPPPPAETSFDDLIPTAGVISTLSSKEGGHNADATSTTKATITATTTTLHVATAKCEPKVLDEIPSVPFYDYTDLAEDAARQFTEFLATKFSGSTPPMQQEITDQMREEVRRRANGIATYALQQDESLLAFAIAAPSIHTVVVKFRDNVTIPPEQIHNKAFLGSYWRELGFAWNSSDGSPEWGAPFRDCNLLKGRWLWPFRISFTENKIKIVAAAFIAADVDVCNDDLEEVFGRTHGCDRNTTFCLLMESKPSASRDAYTCICRESYYLPNSTLQGFQGDIVEASEGFDNYSCIPCPGGCSTCDQHGVCLFGEPQETVSMENLLRVSVGSVLGACILCCIVLGVIVFRQRKCKAIATGMWTVLETILLGIVLLYVSVAVHFFPASTERCLIEPWLRELGFITCYGAIILKLYRHLVDFRTRKAHRWVLRDVDLLKYLGTMVFAVICYMAAFTASSLDLIETAQLEGLQEVSTNTCHPLKWEYVTQVSEALIICFGLHLAFASRNANTQFRERQFLVASLAIEFLVSSSYYILRVIYLPELSPGAMLLALFLRSQLTNTISMGLIFVPKLWYQHKQVRSLAHDLSIRLPVDAFKGSHDVGHHLGGGYAGLCLGDPDVGELTISEMSPEDIRAELKRLYTQLEILKNKTLRQDNPHISKRRGGRKAGHRRFSLQALSAKHRSNKHHQDIEITEAEPSRTPEDSICPQQKMGEDGNCPHAPAHPVMTRSAHDHHPQITLTLEEASQITTLVR